MPIYEYLCSECGAFTAMRPMAECDLPSDCPTCGASASRVILTAPHCSMMPAATRLAPWHQRAQRPCAAFAGVAQGLSRHRMRVLFRKVIPHDQAPRGRL